MKLRAIVFDLYGTLLQLGPPAEEPAALWEAAWRSALGSPPRLTLPRFFAACDQAVAAEHAAARAGGIAFPEVHWPGIVDTVLPEFAPLPAAVKAGLPVYTAALRHTTRLMPGAAAVLRTARAASLRLGLASNCQPYSLLEFDAALAAAGLDRAIFDPGLRFLSFEHGFSKPDPHVFRLLGARLRAGGVAPAEALMVGDRADNDLAPARTQGWAAFAIGPDPAAAWSHLHDLLRRATPAPPAGLDLPPLPEHVT